MAKTLISEVLGTDVSVYNAANPHGFGVIGNGEMPSIPIGARLAGERGFSVACQSTAAPSYVKSWVNPAATASFNTFATAFIRFLSFDSYKDAHGGGDNTSALFDFFNTIVAGVPTYVTGGSAITIKGSGVIGATASSYTSDSPSALELGVWYKIILESTFVSATARDFWVSIGPADGSTPLMTVAVSAELTSALQTYMGFSNRGTTGNSAGGNWELSGVRYYTTAATGFTTNAITTATSADITVVSTAGMGVGTLVTGIGIAKGTTVTGINGTTVTLSSAVTATYGPFPVFFWAAANATDYASFPTDLLVPPDGPFEFWIRNDATFAGDGSANDAEHAMTWDKACVAAPYICPTPAANWVLTSNGTAVVPSAHDADELAEWFKYGVMGYTPTGTVFRLGTSVSATLAFSASCELDGRGFTVDGSVVLDPETATQYDAENYPSVWVISAPPKVALFRARADAAVWLGHIAGAAIDGAGNDSGDAYDTVAEAINTLPDSWWNDDAGHIYFSAPTGSPTGHGYFHTMTNPGSVLGVYGMVGINGYLHNITVRGIMGLNPDASAVSTYGVLLDDTTLTIARNIRTRLMGYHAIGINSVAAHGRAVLINANVGPAWPCENDDYRYWTNNGGQMAFVAYNDGVGTDSQVYIERMTTPEGSDGLVGTTLGFANPTTPSIGSHNAGSGTQFSKDWIISSAVSGTIDLPALVAAAYITTDTTAADIDVTNQEAYATPLPTALYVRYDAIGGGDGTENTAVKALTWAEATALLNQWTAADEIPMTSTIESLKWLISGPRHARRGIQHQISSTVQTLPFALGIQHSA